MRILGITVLAIIALGMPVMADSYSGIVSDVKHFHNGGVAIDLDGHYPHQRMALYVPPADAAAVGPIPTVGTKVTANGTIKPYHGKPEIKILKADQWKW
jgi:hypothetical protein